MKLWQQQLSEGLAEMELTVSSAQQEQLLNYLALLQKWNKKTNLTAIRNPDIMVSRQLLDSLSIQPYINQKKICDIGAGAGLPSIPLAIINPDKHFTLIDSNNKKTRFMLQAKFTLKLDNIEVLNQRVEDIQLKFDLVTSRAFANLLDIIKYERALLADNGAFLCMKGQLPIAEIKQLQEDEHWQITTIELKVPNETGLRNLVVIKAG